MAARTQIGQIEAEMAQLRLIEQFGSTMMMMMMMMSNHVMSDDVMSDDGHGDVMSHDGAGRL
jgi:hypothetical protein